MTIEAETFFLGRRVRTRTLTPGTKLTSVEKERWWPQDPNWDSYKLFLVINIVDAERIEVYSSFNKRRRSEDLNHEITLEGAQIEGKVIRGRVTTTVLSFKS
jgi:hypothetical protein